MFGGLEVLTYLMIVDIEGGSIHVTLILVQFFLYREIILNVEMFDGMLSLATLSTIFGKD